MDILFTLAIIALLFGVINGSYFSIASVDDGKLFSNRFFKFSLYTCQLICFVMLLVYLLDSNIINSSKDFFVIVCGGTSFLAYSTGYQASHHIFYKTQKERDQFY